MKKDLLSCIVLIPLVLTGCNLLSTPTPPPGWRDPVYRLLLQDDSFPTSWGKNYDVPERAKDPTANHVTMDWGNDTNGGLVHQSIWRAYTIEDAKSKFNELRHPPYEPDRTNTVNTKYVAFAPPTEIKVDNIKADEFYITCGWLDYAYCIIASRYRNYAISLYIDLSDTIGNYKQTKGLTYFEIETLIRDMDETFTTIQK